MSFSLIIELSGEKYKTMIGQFMMLGFIVGEVTIGVVAIFVRDYKMFQIVLSFPCFMLLSAYYVIPESPRWLLAKHRYLEADDVIMNAAKFNKVHKNKVKCQ